MTSFLFLQLYKLEVTARTKHNECSRYKYKNVYVTVLLERRSLNTHDCKYGRVIGLPSSVILHNNVLCCLFLVCFKIV